MEGTQGQGTQALNECVATHSCATQQCTGWCPPSPTRTTARPSHPLPHPASPLYLRQPPMSMQVTRAARQPSPQRRTRRSPASMLPKAINSPVLALPPRLLRPLEPPPSPPTDSSPHMRGGLGSSGAGGGAQHAGEVAGVSDVCPQIEWPPLSLLLLQPQPAHMRPAAATRTCIWARAPTAHHDDDARLARGQPLVCGPRCVCTLAAAPGTTQGQMLEGWS